MGRLRLRLPGMMGIVPCSRSVARNRFASYLGLYILVFLADDAALVVIAMTTLKMVSLDGAYSRWVRLIGGLVMLALGILMIFKPEWLTFGCKGEKILSQLAGSLPTSSKSRWR
jgi:hypothetical protein